MEADAQDNRDGTPPSNCNANMSTPGTDGNSPRIYRIDPDDADELAEAKRLNERMVMRALAMDGTCTGEHGIGYGKRDFLQAEHGEAVSVMRLLKQALDPDNIMNPGKVVRV